MSYIDFADFRPGSTKWYTHALTLTIDDADDNALSDAITAMSEQFDLYTFDHFSPEPGDGPPETTTVLNVPGSGGPNLYVPKRIRSITDVSLRDLNGTLTSQPASAYRVTQSLIDGERQEADLDMVSIVPGQFLSGTGWWDPTDDNWTYPGSWTFWPLGVDTVQLTGQFSWPNTPEGVKRAVALMTYDAIKPQGDVLRRADRWNTATASYTMGATQPTGLSEVDRIIGQFTRDRVPAI